MAFVWLAAVLDGGDRALFRVLYRDSRDAGCSYDAIVGLSVGQQGSDGVAVRADV